MKSYFAHLNINSLTSNFEILIGQTLGNIDILMVSEKKIDESFPRSQFITEGFGVLYRENQNAYNGEITLILREDISSILVSSKHSLAKTLPLR